MPIVVIGLLAAGFRFWGITWGLHNAVVERRTHPDEWVVYWLFRWFKSGHNLDPCPQYPHQCFFDWGMGFPYAAYLLHTLLQPVFAVLPANFAGPRADPQFVLAVLSGRLTSALFSVGTVWLAYRLGLRLYSRPAALLAALVVALSTLLIQLGHFATPDSTTGFFLVLALLAIVRAGESGSGWHWIQAGVVIGVAAACEYHMVLLLVPLCAAWLLSTQRAFIAITLACIASGVAFLALNPYLLLDLGAFISATEHTLRIRTVDSGIQYGDRWAPYSPSWLYVVRFPLGYGEGFALSAWLLAGFAVGLLRRTRGDIILLCWIVPYFALVTLEPAKFMRYSAPLLVPLAVLGAGALVALASRLPVYGRAVLIALAAVSLTYTGVYASAYAGLFSTPDPRIAAGSWLRSHTSPGAAVAYEEIPDGVVNMPYFQPASLRLCIDQYHLERLHGVSYVVLDSYTGEEQTAAVRAKMRRFVVALGKAPFHLSQTLHYEPTFLGLQFPIDGSPHDFRYMAHQIHIYRENPVAGSTGRYCFATIDQAARALYVPPAKGGG